MPLDNKCRIGPLAGAPPDTCAVVISTETESGFITEDDTSVCVPEVGKNPVDTYDVGSVISVLARTSASQANFGQSSPLGTAMAGSDVVQSGRPIFDDYFQHLWPYIGNNTANVVFQMVKRLWLIRIDQ
ncbi:hypothetical protein TNCV_5016931 [Trichonephila clavipes]|nr:hypothetical protein TNCV_5016931 [Trichonephila clavipes]